MSEDIIASLGSAACIARHAFRGDIQSGLSDRARWFQVVPGSSSSWSIELSCCAHRDFISAIFCFLSVRLKSPAVSDSLDRILFATSDASPMIPTLTFLVKPILSGLIST